MKLVIGGTFAWGPLARQHYKRLTEILDADLMLLPGLGLRHTSRAVRDIVRTLEHSRYYGATEPALLVGHSQGGLAAAMVAHERPDLVAGVVTLAAPLKGTKISPRWSLFGAARCMAPGANYTRQLARTTPMLNVVTTADRVVIPWTSGLLDGADHYVVDGVGHVGLAVDERVVDQVVAWDLFRRIEAA